MIFVKWENFEGNIEEFLSIDLSVPVFQRGYVWGVRNFSQFLYGLCMNTIEGRPIVAFKEDEKFQIVDGHQRTTSTYLLYSDYFVGREDLNPKAAQNIENFFIERPGIEPFSTRKVMKELRNIDSFFDDRKTIKKLTAFSEKYYDGKFTLRMLEDFENTFGSTPIVTALINGIKNARISMKIMTNVDRMTALKIFAIMNKNQVKLSLGRNAVSFTYDMRFVDIVENFASRISKILTPSMIRNEAGITIALLILRTITKINDGEAVIISPATSLETFAENITYNYQLEHLAKFVIDVTSLPAPARESYFKKAASVLNSIAENMIASIPRTRKEGGKKSKYDNTILLAFMGVGLYRRYLHQSTNVHAKIGGDSWRTMAFNKFINSLQNCTNSISAYTSYDEWKGETNNQNSKKLRELFKLIDVAMDSAYGEPLENHEKVRRQVRNYMKTVIDELRSRGYPVRCGITGLDILPGEPWEAAHLTSAVNTTTTDGVMYFTIALPVGNRAQNTGSVPPELVKENGGILFEVEVKKIDPRNPVVKSIRIV